MTKKYYAEIERERDYWRNKAQEYKDENTRLREQNNTLKRQLERQSIFTEVLTVGALERLDQKIETIQTERDNYKAKLDHLCDLLIKHGEMADKLLTHVTEENKGFFDDLQQSIDEYSASQVTQFIAHVFDRTDSGLVDAIDKSSTFPVVPIDVERYNPESWLHAIAKLNILRGHRLALRNLLIYAYGFSDDPPALADRILRELRTRRDNEGNPDVNIKWLEKLPEVYMGELGNPKISTLKTGLIEVQKFKNSGLDQVEYIRKGSASCSERTLRDYIKWYERLEQSAKTKTPYIDWTLEA